MRINPTSTHAASGGGSASTARSVTVARGDTLSAIAARAGVSLQSLIAANPQIRNPNVIYPGDRVRIPGGHASGSGHANGSAHASGSGHAPASQRSGASSQPGAASGGAQMPSQMKLSQDGLNMVKKYEGLYTKAYYCPAGVLTIGYGHTGPDVKPGQRISEAQAESLLRQDMTQFENAVKRQVKVPLTQGQFDALTSFTFNCGEGALKNSTLLKKLNAGDYAGAQAEFQRWNKGGGRVLPGLVKRRAEEAQMFGSSGPQTKPGSPYPQPQVRAPAQGPAPAQSKGMPNTQGMSPQQKFDTYASYINQHGDAQSKKDLASGKAVVLALRQDTPMSQGPRDGTYDDRIVVLKKTASGPQVTELVGNTEPNRKYAEQMGGSKPVGRLADGQTVRYHKDNNARFGNHLRPSGNPLAQRDANRNMRFDSNEKSYSGSWGGQAMLVHKAGTTTTGSQGCQTMSPAEFQRFWAALGSQNDVSYVLVNASR